MVCVKCGSENNSGAKYCSNCNALLFKAAPTGLPNASSLDLEELVDYPVPETHYQSPLLQQLAWSIHEFIEEEGELEPILETYDAFREVFDGFRLEIPNLEDYTYEEKGKWDDDPIPSQIKYLISKAEEFFEKGEEEFEAYFNLLDELDEDEEAEFPDPQPMIEATKKWLNCNDNICLVFEFLVGRGRAFKEMAAETAAEIAALDAGEYDDEDEEAAPAVEAEPEPTHVAPLDSSDLG